MYKLTLHILLSFLAVATISFTSFGQGSAQASPQDCLGAIPVCQPVYVQPDAFLGSGQYPAEINPSNSCLETGETNSVWYIINIKSRGNLNFVITPNDLEDDYDFALYNISGVACGDLFADPNALVSCNYANTGGPTGADGSTNSNSGESFDSPFNAEIPVRKGETFVLTINNYSASQSGYELNFENSSASIYDDVAPQLSNVVVPEGTCNVESFDMVFSERIDCQTLDKSDFTLTSALGEHQIISLSSNTCASRRFTATISPPINIATEAILSVTSNAVDLCGNSLETTILPFSIDGIQINNAIRNPSCFNTANGSINLSIQGGSAPYAYLWNTGNTNESLQKIAGGTYQVTITDQNHCQAFENFTVHSPDSLLVDGSITSATCHGKSDGSIAALPKGGTGFYRFIWDNGSAANRVSGLAAGTYNITIEDEAGCRISENFEVDEPDPIEINLAILPIICAGSASGCIESAVQGGTAPYTYHWNNAGRSSKIQLLQAGYYEVTVEDKNGCRLNEGTSLTEPPLLQAKLTSTDASCFNSEDGQLSAIASGGSGTYTYQWSNNKEGQINEHIMPGNYAVTITDDLGCSITETASILGSTPIKIEDVDISEPYCAAANGSIEVEAKGGHGLLTYTWQNGITNPYINQLTIGTYSLNIADSLGCSMDTVFQMESYFELSLNSSVSSTSCYNASDGAVAINVTNGTPPYYISWRNGQFGNTRSNLSAGSYPVLVYDKNGCSGTDTISIAQPEPIVIDLETKNIACKGSELGTARINSIAGGTAPYAIRWPNNTSTHSIDGLEAGQYQLEVSDRNNCAAVEHFAIVENKVLEINSTTTPTSCHNTYDGGATLQISGGLPPYRYQWDIGASTQSLQRLPKGTYAVTVKDVLNCQNSGLVTVAGPNKLESYSIKKDPACHNGEDGFIQINAIGGTAPWQITWAHTTEYSAVFTNLMAGDYAYTVTDVNGCITSGATALDNPSLIEVNATIEPALCLANNGYVKLDASGGKAPYQYLWNNGSDSNCIDELQARTYTAMITDANKCSFNYTVEVPSKNNLEFEVFEKQKPTCNQQNMGIYSTNILSGTPPFAYLWSNGSFEIDAKGIGSGNHLVTVTDANGCSRVQTFEVEELDLLELKLFLQEPTCHQGSDGYITAETISGALPIEYEWNNSKTTSLIDNLSSGVYAVTAVDNNGCIFKESIVLQDADPIQLNLKVDSNVVFGQSVSAEITAYPPSNYEYIFSTNNNNVYSANGSASILPSESGFVYVEVVSSDGCVSVDSFFIEVSSANKINLPTAFAPQSGGIDALFPGKLYEEFTLQHIEIYNRWGQLLYAGSADWNGYAGSQLQPTGIYAYKIIYQLNKSQQRHILEGNLTLVR